MEENEGQKRIDEGRECDDLQASPGQAEEISSTSASDYVLHEGPESEDGSAGLVSSDASLASASFQERDEPEGILVEGSGIASELQQLPVTQKKNDGGCDDLQPSPGQTEEISSTSPSDYVLPEYPQAWIDALTLATASFQLDEEPEGALSNEHSLGIGHCATVSEHRQLGKSVADGSELGHTEVPEPQFAVCVSPEKMEVDEPSDDEGAENENDETESVDTIVAMDEVYGYTTDSQFRVVTMKEKHRRGFEAAVLVSASTHAADALPSHATSDQHASVHSDTDSPSFPVQPEPKTYLKRRGTKPKTPSKSLTPNTEPPLLITIPTSRSDEQWRQNASASGLEFGFDINERMLQASIFPSSISSRSSIDNSVPSNERESKGCLQPKDKPTISRDPRKQKYIDLFKSDSSISSRSSSDYSVPSNEGESKGCLKPKDKLTISRDQVKQKYINLFKSDSSISSRSSSDYSVPRNEGKLKGCLETKDKPTISRDQVKQKYIDLFKSDSSISSRFYSPWSKEGGSKESLEPKDKPSIWTQPWPQKNLRMLKSEEMPGHRSDLAEKDIDTILKFIEYDEKPSKGLKKKQKPTHRKKHTKEIPMASSVVVENQPKIEGITDKTPLVEEQRRNREKDEVYGYTTDGQLREVTMKEKHRRGVEAAMLVPVSTPAAEVLPCQPASTQDASVHSHTASPAIPVMPEHKLDPKQGGTKPKTPLKSLRPNTDPPEPFIQDAVYGCTTDSQSQAVVMKKKRRRGVQAAAQSAGAVVVPVSTPAAEVLPCQSASTQDASVLSHTASPAIPVKPKHKPDPKQGGTKPKTPSKSLTPNTEPPEPFIQDAVYGYTTDSQSQAVVMKKKRRRRVKAAAQSAGAVVVPVSTPAAEVLPCQSASTQDASVLSHTASPAIPVKPKHKPDPKQGGTKPKTPSKSLTPNTEPPEPFIQDAVYGYTTDSQSQAVVMKTKPRRRGVEAAAQSGGAMVVPVSTPAAEVLPCQSASNQDAFVLSYTDFPAIPVKLQAKPDPKQGGTKPKTPLKSLRPNTDPPVLFTSQTSLSDEQRRQSASARRLESVHLHRKVYWGKTGSTNERLRSVQPEPMKLPPQRFADKVTESCTKNYCEVVKASMTPPISKPSSRRISIVTTSSTGGDRNASEPTTVKLALAESLPSQVEAVPMTARKTEDRCSKTSHVVCGHFSGATMPKLAVPGVTPVYTSCCPKQCHLVLVITRTMSEKGTMTEECMGIPPQPSAPVEAQQDLPQQEPERPEEEYTDEECEEEEADAHPPAISESHRALVEYFARTFDEALNDPETVIYGEED